MLSLDDRKKRILATVVENYIEKAEPVGSQQVADEYENEYSSATIRNEMKQLEEYGLLEQPHVSAGRVPSTLGYRYYVDNLMKNDTLNMAEIDYLNNNIVSYGNVDATLTNAMQVISKMLNLPTVLNVTSTDVVESVKILKISEKLLLIVLMSKGGTVKDVIVKINDSLPATRIEELSGLLNKNLKGTPLESLPKALNSVITSELKKFSGIIDNLKYMMQKEISERSKMSTDITALLSMPEFSEPNEIKKFMNVVTTSDILNDVLSQVESGNVSVIIGNEHDELLLNDYSLISLDMYSGDATNAKVGLLSPKRVDYNKAIATLKYVNERLKKIFKSQNEEGKNGKHPRGKEEQEEGS